ncbi:MAG TPA: hypothetical protein VNK48_14330 [Xanthobacteraceae bacterium]|nr:hypothetical protein [Xanthobacteraceae bacterium]
MPWNGAGTFSRVYGSTGWVTDRGNGTKIVADRHDTHDEDLASGINNALCKDGQNSPTADIPWNNKRITGLGNATADSHALNRITADGRYLRKTGITDVASAATTDVLGAATDVVRITGTTTITSLGTTANAIKIVYFAASLTLTHNATSLILPGGANITTAAGDCMGVISDAAGNARVIFYELASGGTLSTVDDVDIVWSAEATVASAGTTDIGAAAALRVLITGTTTITSLGTTANKMRWVRFADALTLTHNATSLILPGGANITTAAGDTALFSSDGSGNWRCRHYQRASGKAVTTAITSADIPNDAVTYAQLQNVSATDRLLGRASAGAGDVEEIACTAAGRALLDDADAAAQRTTLGLGTAAVLNAGTSANNVVQLDGSAKLPAVDGSQLTNLPGRQRAYAEYTANASLSATIPLDDTIPQNTEGTEIVTASITPSSSSNRVRITFTAFGVGASNGEQYGIAALFRDSVANALHATMTPLRATGGGCTAIDVGGILAFSFEHAPATTSSITYKVRVGPNTSTMRLNGKSSGRLFGGVAAATLVVEEIVP